MHLSHRDFNRIPWENIINVSDEDIPPFSLVWNDGDDDGWANDGTGHILIPVRRGEDEAGFSSHGGERWMITGPFTIKQGMKGIASVPSYNQPMVVSIDSGESAGYTENVEVGPLFGDDGAPASFGVTANSTLPLWSAIALVQNNDGSTATDKYWVGPLQKTQPNVLLKNYVSALGLSGTTSKVELFRLDSVPKPAMYEVKFMCRVSINKKATTLTVMLGSTSSKYPLTDTWQSGRSTPDLSLSYGTENDVQSTPGSENIAIFGYVPADKGDSIVVFFQCSQSCQLVFSDCTIAAVVYGPPNLGDPIPTG